MDLYTLILIGLFIVCLTILLSKYIGFLTKKQSQIVTQQIKGSQRKDKKLIDYVDDVPAALQYAKQVYDEQLKIANERFIPMVQQGKITEDQMKKEITAIMKPLKERIDFLETVQKWEPAVRVGAGIGDGIVKVINKGIEDMGGA